MKRLALATLLAAASALAVAPAFSQLAPNQVRIRGTLEKLDGNTMMVKSNSGQSMTVKLPDNLVVMGIAKASVADIGNGKYVGTTTVGERDGAMVALEVHIFPEKMRGAGEGHRDWDLRPQSKMTNANVANITSMGKDKVLTIQYKGGEQKILVDDSTVVVSFVPTDRAALKPGAGVFMTAEKAADGSLSTPRVNVGLNGAIPPM